LFGELDGISIGDVNVFRDWSHIEDIVDGYVLLAEKVNQEMSMFRVL